MQDEPIEFGMNNVLVLLYDASNQYLNFKITTSGGYYEFPNLSAGTYILKFVPQPGYAFTTQNAHSDFVDYMDSDVGADGMVTVTLQSGSTSSVDAGIVRVIRAMPHTVYMPNTMRNASASW